MLQRRLEACVTAHVIVIFLEYLQGNPKLKKVSD